jgi:hypothetical protein
MEAFADPTAYCRNAAAACPVRVIAIVMVTSTILQGNPTIQPQAAPTHILVKASGGFY